MKEQRKNHENFDSILCRILTAIVILSGKCTWTCRDGIGVHVHWAEIRTHDVNLCTVHALFAQRAGNQNDPKGAENASEPTPDC